MLAFLEIEYVEGDPETYVVPLAFASGERAQDVRHRLPHAVLSLLKVTGEGGREELGVLYDALATGEVATALLDAMGRGKTFPGEEGRVTFTPTAGLSPVLESGDLVPRVVELEQTNTTVPFGDRAILKVFRQLEMGVNSEIEIGEFLSREGSRTAPRVLGTAHYHVGRTGTAALAVVHEYVANQGSAWDLMLGHIETLFDRVLPEKLAPPPRPAPLAQLLDTEPPKVLSDIATLHIRHAELLGKRTGQLHLNLVSTKGEAPFAPEPFTMMHQQSLYQGARALMTRTMEALNKRLGKLPENVVADVRSVIAAQPLIEARLRKMVEKPISGIRIRSHGDLHLGQVLFTGDDFVIIDFEGEPARPLNERRYKRSPLRDVAGMLRSFAYASESWIRNGQHRPGDAEAMRPWCDAWSAWMNASLLKSYLDVIGGSVLAPINEGERNLMLDFYTLEKCIYEINYELNNRPTWLPIPIRGLIDLLK